MKAILVKRVSRIMIVVGCVIVLSGIFIVSDYIAVSQFRQVPRFSYEKSYGENIVEHKTLFYTVIQKNPGTANESIEIAKWWKWSSLVGEILNVCTDESVITDGKIDPKKLKPIAFDPCNNTYTGLVNVVGKAFGDEMW